MGSLYYGIDGGGRLEVDDRVLSHLQIVIVTKLRRGEAFALTLGRATAQGSGRTSLWVGPGIPLRFEYAGSRSPAINRDWLEMLAATAATTHGLHVVDEPEIAAKNAASAEL